MRIEDYIKNIVRYTKYPGVTMSLIIPTKELVFDLSGDLKDTIHLYPDMDLIFIRLLGALTYKEKAMWELEREKMRFSKVMESIEPNKAELVGDSIYDIGKRLYQLLNGVDAYENGYLCYLKDRWVGSDLILRKLTKDEIPEIY